MYLSDDSSVNTGVIRNSNDETVILMSDEYRVVTADTGQVSFVRSHRAPRGIATYIMMIVIGGMLIGMTIFAIGAIFGVSIGN